MKKLVQISFAENLVEKIKRIAESKGLNMSAFIKMVLVEKVKEEDRDLLGENGFSEKEEERILKSISRFNEKKEKGELKRAKNAEEFLAQI